MEEEFLEGKRKYLELLEQHSQADTQRAFLLYMVTDKCSFNKQRKEVMSYATQSLTLSRKLAYTHGLARSYYWFGQYYKGLMEYEKALAYFDSTFYVLQAEQSGFALRVKGTALRTKAKVYQQWEEYPRALELYFQSLAYQENAPDPYTVYTYKDIANIYTYLHNPTKAQEYGELYLKKSEQAQKQVTKLDAYLFMARLCMGQNDWEKATTYLDKMKPFMPDTIEVNMTYSYYLHLGKNYTHHNQHAQAQAAYETALRFAEEGAHGLPIHEVVSALFQNSMAQGNLSTAEGYAKRGIKLAEESGNRLNRVAALSYLAEYEQQTGKSQLAYEHLWQAFILKDSLLAAENQKQANLLDARFQREKKEREIKQLTAENAIQQLTIQNQSRRNWILFLLVLGLTLAFALGYLYVQQRQSLQQQRILQLEKDKQLLRAEAILKGQEEERARLAKDLHDGLGGMLSGIKMSLSGMKESVVMPAEFAEGFERAISLMDASIRELRQIAHNLMPEALMRMGLTAALADFCNKIESSTGVSVHFQQIGQSRPLSQTADIAIYRIVQELAHNAIKHAQATEIVVQIGIEPSEIQLTVEDNGKGFNPKETDKDRDGIGLYSVRTRVEYLNGRLNIKSEAEGGTSFHVVLKV